MPPQHEHQQQTEMISPASMPSELQGAMNNNNNHHHNNNGCCSSWQKDQMFLEDLNDVLTFLKAQEASYDRRKNRRKQQKQSQQQQPQTSNINNNLPPFHDSWRPVMISWMYHVADTFRLMPIVVATGVYILDTCALELETSSSSSKKSKELYPLMTMTALNMAVKCHETKMFPLDQLVQLLGAGGGSSSDGGYTPEDVCAMERKMLNLCGWKLHCPTTHDYLLRFVTVLAQEQDRGAVITSALLHLKTSLLWEHVSHQKQTTATTHHRQEQQHESFSSCTMAYAAFLLAMEDAGLPLGDKQAACLALLEVANLSAQTPKLSQAYNWLLQARSLQAQLESTPGKNNHSNTAAASTSYSNSVPAHAHVIEEEPIDILNDSHTSDQMSCDTTTSSSSQRQEQTDGDLLLLSFDNEEDDEQQQQQEQPPVTATNDRYAIVEDDDDNSTSFMSNGSSSISSITTPEQEEVIFCSYSSDGDAFEVVAANNIICDEHDDDDEEEEEFEEDDEDDQSMMDDHSIAMTILPTVMEEDGEEYSNHHPNVVEDEDDDNSGEEDDSATKLVLTESLDEDGFEVAFKGNDNNSAVDRLSNFFASPREVAVNI